MSEHLPNLVQCLQHAYCAVRHLAARCVGVLSTVSSVETMRTVVENVLPLMGTVDVVRNRQGAVEAVSCILHSKTKTFYAKVIAAVVLSQFS